MIEKGRIERAVRGAGLAHERQRLIRRTCGYGLDAAEKKLSHQDFAIGGVVIHHEYAPAFERGGYRIMGLQAGDDRREMRSETEKRAGAFQTFNTGFPTHQLDETPYDRQSQSRAAESAGGRCVYLRKR